MVSWSLYNITNTGMSYSFGQNGRMGFSLVLLMQWLHLVSLNQIQFSLGCTERNITKWYRGDWWLSPSFYGVLWNGYKEWNIFGLEKEGIITPVVLALRSI